MAVVLVYRLTCSAQQTQPPLPVRGFRARRLARAKHQSRLESELTLRSRSCLTPRLFGILLLDLPLSPTGLQQCIPREEKTEAAGKRSLCPSPGSSLPKFGLTSNSGFEKAVGPVSFAVRKTTGSGRKVLGNSMRRMEGRI